MLNKDNFIIKENKISLIHLKDKENYKKLFFILLQHDQITKKIICQKATAQKEKELIFPFKYDIYLPICLLAVESSDQKDSLKYAEKIARELNEALKYLDLHHLPNQKEYLEAHKATFQTKTDEIISHYLNLERELSDAEGLLSFINTNEANVLETGASHLCPESFYHFNVIKQFKFFLEENIKDLTALKEKIIRLDASEVLIKNKQNIERSIPEIVDIFITQTKLCLDDDSKTISNYKDYEALRKTYKDFIIKNNNVFITLEVEGKELLKISQKIQGLKEKVNELPKNKNYLDSLDSLDNQVNNTIKDKNLLHNKETTTDLKKRFADLNTSINKKLSYYNELLHPQLKRLHKSEVLVSTIKKGLYSAASVDKFNFHQVETELEKTKKRILRCKNQSDLDKVKWDLSILEVDLGKIEIDCKKENSLSIKEHLYGLYRLYKPTKPLKLMLTEEHESNRLTRHFKSGHLETLKKDLNRCSLNPQAKLINKNLVTGIETLLFYPQEAVLYSIPPERTLKKQDLSLILAHCFEQKESQQIEQSIKQNLQDLLPQLNQHIQDLQNPPSFFKRLIKLFFSQSTREKIQIESEILKKVEDLIPSIEEGSFEEKVRLYKETQEKLNHAVIDKYRGFAFFKANGIPKSQHLGMKAKVALEIVNIQAHLSR